MISQISESLKQLYFSDERPWVVGYSGGKDSTMLVSLVFEMLLSLMPDKRTKDVSIVCTDTCVEIPAVVDRVNNELTCMQCCADEHNLGVSTHLLKPPADQSFWVNLIGRGYPPPNHSFRWCTQRLKIDPVNVFLRKKVGQWGEAVILIGARRSESGTRAQAMAARVKNYQKLSRHDNLPRCWVSTPIEYLSTDDVWNYLFDNPNPWHGDNKGLFELYKNASGGECPLVLDQSTPSCGNSRFGCWTCTVVERDKASEGLLASGDQRMEFLLRFRDVLITMRDPQNGFRDLVRKNGQTGPGPLKIEARKKLLTKLLALQDNIGLSIISEDELHWIQTFWNSARNPDDGSGVVNIIFQQKGMVMPKLRDDNQLHAIEQEVAKEKGVSVDTLRRLVETVERYGESHRAVGLLDELNQILQDELTKINKGE